MLTMVMPLGGSGKHFADKGYSFPKPLIEIEGQPMIEVVVRNVMPAEPTRNVFVCSREHVEHFALSEVLQLIAPGARVIPSNRTAGALCSVLLAIDEIAQADELIIANADQFLDVSIDDFLAAARAGNWDGFIMTFPSSHPKWSFVKIEEGEVVSVAEKRPISDQATTGIYYFRSAKDFLAAAERTLLKNASVEGEFYVCPVYNEMILMRKRIGVFPIRRDQMHSLGTPEELERFVKLGRVVP